MKKATVSSSLFLKVLKLFPLADSPWIVCPDRMGEEYLQQFLDETSLFNNFLLGNILPTGVWDPLLHFLQPLLRKVASMGTKLKETVKGYLSGFNSQKFAQASDTSIWVKVCLILFLAFTTGPNGVRSDEDIGNPLIPGGRAMDSPLANKTLRGFNLSQRRQLVGAEAGAAINGIINYNNFPRGNSPSNNPGRKRANPYQRPCNSAEYCRQGNKGKKN